MKLIAVTGRARHGKDSFAAPLIDSGLFTRVRFADPLKAMLTQLFLSAGVDQQTAERMIDGDLKEVPTPILLGKTPRYAMQTLGTEWRNMMGESLWLNIAEQKIRSCAKFGVHGVVVTDMRFPHEAVLMEKLGATRVRIVGNRATTAESTHASETMIDQLPVDMEIYNYGTLDDLREMTLLVSDGVKNCSI